VSIFIGEKTISEETFKRFHLSLIGQDWAILYATDAKETGQRGKFLTFGGPL
jgi:hypothetical protein